MWPRRQKQLSCDEWRPMKAEKNSDIFARVMQMILTQHNTTTSSQVSLNLPWYAQRQRAHATDDCAKDCEWKLERERKKFLVNIVCRCLLVELISAFHHHHLAPKKKALRSSHTGRKAERWWLDWIRSVQVRCCKRFRIGAQEQDEEIAKIDCLPQYIVIGCRKLASPAGSGSFLCHCC